MTIDSRKSKRGMATMLKKIAVAAAFGACSLAQAGVLNFEGSTGDSPFIFQGDHIRFGDYWTESYGGTRSGDFVGTIIDGSDNGLCAISCPVNNPTNYYAALDDGYFYFGMNDDSNFKVSSLKASFIGAGQASFPATAGVLQLQGFDFDGNALGGALQLGLGGPTAGAFNFATYDFAGTAFANTYFSYVRVLGFSCATGANGNCIRNGDLANFAVDDIVTVPEPTSWALFGLGLIGLGVFSRRRAN